MQLRYTIDYGWVGARKRGMKKRTWWTRTLDEGLRKGRRSERVIYPREVRVTRCLLVSCFDTHAISRLLKLKQHTTWTVKTSLKNVVRVTLWRILKMSQSWLFGPGTIVLLFFVLTRSPITSLTRSQHDAKDAYEGREHSREKEASSLGLEFSSRTSSVLFCSLAERLIVSTGRTTRVSSIRYDWGRP